MYLSFAIKSGMKKIGEFLDTSLNVTSTTQDCPFNFEKALMAKIKMHFLKKSKKIYAMYFYTHFFQVTS
jgi:hypothetical protein